MNAKMIIAVKYATYAVAKGKPEKKNRTWQDLVLDFSATKVQRSDLTNRLILVY